MLNQAISKTSLTKSNTIRTRITSLFQCQYPIILPGMSWISTPELVAAVSNAGGIGILATGPLNASETRSSIQKIRSLLKSDDIPFGIGATLLMPGAEENANVALEEQVPIINVSLGKAEWIADGLQKYGGKMIATVTNSKHATAAIEVGADALMVTGHEAAAHGGDVTSLVLVPTMSQQFPDIPIIAAGGFANGRGLVAAMSLGADGIAMGSRLAVTQESTLADATKHAIVNSTEMDTIYGSNFDGIPARVLKTPISEKAMKSRPWLPQIVYRSFMAAKQMNIPLWKVLPGLLTQYDKMYAVAQFGAATQQIMAATVDGNLYGGTRTTTSTSSDEDNSKKQGNGTGNGNGNGGVQFIGQCQGLINDIPIVDDLIQRIVLEATIIQYQQQQQFRDVCDNSENGSSFNNNKNVISNKDDDDDDEEAKIA